MTNTVTVYSRKDIEEMINNAIDKEMNRINFILDEIRLRIIDIERLIK